MKKRTQMKYEESPEATEFRRLEHRLYNNAALAKHKVFMVTSANISEGKSTVSSYLALTHAHYRSLRTLLIDCDLRRPRIHKMFNLPLQNGLAEFLGGQATASETVRDTKVANLKIIPAGVSPLSASELVSSKGIKALVDSFHQDYDMIILDSPPIIPVSDPLILADIVDGIYLVMKAGSTKKRMAKHAIEMLNEKSAKIVGAIINNSTNVMPYYYDYSYYGKKYKQNRRDRKATAKHAHSNNGGT